MTLGDDLHATLADVQPNILAPFRREHAGYYFLEIVSPNAFRATLRRIRRDFLSDQRSVLETPPAFTVNVAFTFTGLQRLGVAPNLLDTFPEPFQEGMAHRGDELGDTRSAASHQWESWYGHPSIHAVIVVSSINDDVDERWAAMTDSEDGRPAGARILMSEFGHVLKDPESGHTIEHFGFRDGISQPAIAGMPEGPEGPDEPIAVGEFLLGHRDESQTLAPPFSETTAELVANGTFMVFRKLEQHVESFWSHMKAAAGGDADHAEALAAELVGRNKAGEPLGEIVRTSEDDLNAFDYTPRQPGEVVTGSHIRRMNPRSGGGDLRASRRRRLLRRGISYTEPVPGSAAGGARKGLFFVCFNARIDAQFEFVQRNWINGGHVVGQPAGNLDPLAGTAQAGDPASGNRFPRAGAKALANLPEFVTVRGGEYFFVPGLDALARLAENEFAPSPQAQQGSTASPDAPAIDPWTFDPVRLDLRPDVVAWTLRQGAFRTHIATADGEPIPLVYVTDEALAREVLSDDGRFGMGLYDDRVRHITNGQRLAVGMNEGDPERLRRLALFAATRGEPDDLADRAGGLATSLTRALLEGRPQFDAVTQLALAVPLQRVQRLFGVSGPERLPDAAVRLHYGRRADDSLEPAWEAALRAEWSHPAEIGMRGLAAWTGLAFLATFQNLYDVPDIADLGRLATSEFLSHLHERIVAERAAETRAGAPTALSRLVHRTDATDTEAALVLLELSAGSTATVTKGIAYAIETLLETPAAQWPRDARGVRAFVGRVHRERPVAPLLVRRARVASHLGELEIAEGSHLFVLTRFAGQGSLDFGAGAHECWGRDVAVREMEAVVTELARYPALRRVAGPRGVLVERMRNPAALWVRTD